MNNQSTLDSRRIIGLVGPIAAGKGTVAEYLQQHYGAAVVAFSTSLKDVLVRLNLETTRDNLIRLSEVLRETFGDDLLARVVAADAAVTTEKLIVVDGIRRPADIAALQQSPGFVLVAVTAAAPVRYRRLLGRSEKIDDKNKSYAEFLNEERRSTEQSLRPLLRQAPVTLTNNGDLTQLHAQIDSLLAGLTNFK